MTVEFCGGIPISWIAMRVRGHFREMFMSKTLTGNGSITMKNLNGTSGKIAVVALAGPLEEVCEDFHDTEMSCRM
jgi:hypothetical protein